MKHALTKQEVVDRFRDTEFVLKTQAQIVRDFERLGHDIESGLLSHSYSLEELIGFVSKMLGDVLKKGEQSTLQLLYQIDVPQSQFLALTTDPEFLPKASELIIRREAQKVYFRSIF